MYAFAAANPEKIALIQDERQLSYGALDAAMDRVAAALQREGVAPGESVAICAATSIEYACAFLGALRAGVAVAPIAPSSTPESIVDMVADCGAKVFFLDKGVADALGDRLGSVKAKLVGLDDGAPGVRHDQFIAPEGEKPTPVIISKEMPFNIIYSSGTTG
ncbi:MAG: AMP-binding protein, partial [Alphaproteobacteria bacterium]